MEHSHKPILEIELLPRHCPGLILTDIRLIPISLWMRMILVLQGAGFPEIPECPATPS
jgi:hypothetical protein